MPHNLGIELHRQRRLLEMAYRYAWGKEGYAGLRDEFNIIRDRMNVGTFTVGPNLIFKWEDAKPLPSNALSVRGSTGKSVVITPHQYVCGLQGYLTIGYPELLALLGEPNIEDDSAKVEASWGFKDEYGRLAAVWCYHTNAKTCKEWSCGGHFDLLSDLFGDAVRKR
jgi:hypothetical protein